MKRLMTALLLLLLVLGTIIPAYAVVEGAEVEWKTLNDEAVSFYQQGNYDRAITTGKKALQVAEQSVKPEAYHSVITSLNNLAHWYNIQGQHTQVEQCYKRVLEISEKSFPGFLDLALINLADMYNHQRQYTQAEPFYKRALAIREKNGMYAVTLPMILTSLAELYEHQGLYAQAELLYKRVLAIWAKNRGPNEISSATPLEKLAAIYWKTGREVDAEDLRKRAADIRAADRRKWEK